HHGLEPVIAHLSGIRVIGPDLPGFGESSPLTEVPTTIDGYAAWLGAFVEKLGLTGTAVIFGHSFGSIVTSTAIANGLKTPKLILLNPIAAPALEGPSAFGTRLTVGFYGLSGWLPRAIGNAVLKNPLVPWFVSVTMIRSKNRRLNRWIHDQHARYFNRFSDRETVIAAFKASISTDVSQVATRVDVPTLLIGSDEDPITTVAALKHVQTLFPKAELTILHGVGHLVHYEMPRVAAEKIVAFLGTGSVVRAANT
ncbi:MAG: alpha/beta hydrolase, partial [Rhodoglobus sp.]